MAFKLGKLPPKEHPRTLKLSHYLLESFEPPPQKTFWEYKVDPATIGMYMNDEIGDCVLAMIAHNIILTTAHTSPRPFFPDVEAVLEAYSKLSGYDPLTGENDNGVDMTTAMDFWRTEGIDGHKILAWAQIDHTSLIHQHAGVHIFGATMSGVNLPQSAQDQFTANEDWELKEDAPIGGHAILKTGYGVRGRNYQTWGKGDQKASDAWGHFYQDEEYVVITQDWLDNATGLAPNSLNMDKLVSDLRELQVQ